MHFSLVDDVAHTQPHDLDLHFSLTVIHCSFNGWFFDVDKALHLLVTFPHLSRVLPGRQYCGLLTDVVIVSSRHCALPRPAPVAACLGSLDVCS